jgi:hypothetical protein
VTVANKKKSGNKRIDKTLFYLSLALLFFWTDNILYLIFLAEEIEIYSFLKSMLKFKKKKTYIKSFISIPWRSSTCPFIYISFKYDKIRNFMLFLEKWDVKT